MRRLTLLARAKINLSLDVLGRLPDGYHEVETVLQSVDLADRVTLREAPAKVTVRCDHPGVPPGEANLAARAAELLRRTAGERRGAVIEIAKAIPVAAGLAGGSADAAAVLWGLNRLWEVGLSDEALRRLAGELGTDVPFALEGGTALGRGRGERLTSLPAPRGLGVVLVHPPAPLTTAAVYRGWDAAPSPSARHTPGVVRALTAGDREELARAVGNDLEPVARRLQPAVAAARAMLLAAGATGVAMSGSGPTVFALAADREAASRLAASLSAPPGWSVLPCRVAWKGIRVSEANIS